MLFIITLTKIDDENEAEEILKWLQNLVNETYQNRDKIEPDYSLKKELKASDIVKLLPGTNCKKCGLLTCLAFAFKLVREQIETEKCTPFFSDELKEKRQVLLEILQNAGLKVPSV